MLLPSLTSYITLENSQGTLDPLGMYSIADRLATRLAPDLRERMKHPRYLTAIAVGAAVCSVFDEEELAADEITPPWQVYEWYVTSAFVKRFEKDDNQQLLGMPSREKTTRAMRDGVPLSALRYLKTPSVFGFHGVYRTLARGIDLTDENRIGEFGVRLLDVWEKEQGLEGFRIGLKGTNGNDFRNRLQEAVLRGMEYGAVAKQWNWDFFYRIADCLAPKSPGKKEAMVLYERLMEGTTSSRAELIQFLISDEGQKAITQNSEKHLHEALLVRAVETKEVLLAIQAYEKVCRLLFNAFYETLQWMSEHQSKGNVSQMSNLPRVKKACKELPKAFDTADRLLEPFREEALFFAQGFEQLRGSFTPADWVKQLFEHHTQVQKNKPPNGKAAWVLEHNSGNYLLNSSQADGVVLSDEYVHQYRTFTLQSFMKDLRKI